MPRPPRTGERVRGWIRRLRSGVRAADQFESAGDGGRTTGADDGSTDDARAPADDAHHDDDQSRARNDGGRDLA
ncbi:MAG: hypothetical protein M3P52_01295 [Actinomycetota bacterium]|nr:hypothetical protein [Actinomycetota bacterium]